MKAPAATAYQQKLNTLCSAMGYSFVDTTLLELALTHRSCGHHNNERLEFLGDSIVNFVIADALFDKFPKAREGQLSRLRTLSKRCDPRSSGKRNAHWPLSEARCW